MANNLENEGKEADTESGDLGHLISILSAERGAVWARYNALLVANSFILGFAEPQTLHVVLFGFSEAKLVGLAGILVCVIWSIIHLYGYRHHGLLIKDIRSEYPRFMRFEHFSQLSWPPIEFQHSHPRFRDPIFWFSLMVLLIVALLYVLKFWI